MAFWKWNHLVIILYVLIVINVGLSGLLFLVKIAFTVFVSVHFKINFESDFQFPQEKNTTKYFAGVLLNLLINLGASDIMTDNEFPNPCKCIFLHLFSSSR